MMLKKQQSTSTGLALNKRSIAQLTPIQMTLVKGGNNNSSYPCQAGQQAGMAAASSGICIGGAAFVGATAIVTIAIATFIPDDRETQ